VFYKALMIKRSNARLPGAPGGFWNGLDFKSSVAFPLVLVLAATEQPIDEVRNDRKKL
jgi:hypothetical protein